MRSAIGSLGDGAGPADATGTEGHGSAGPWLTAGSAFALGLLALIGLFWPTVRSMIETWWNVTTYSHGFVVLPIAAYLVWRKRAILAGIVPRPQPLGLVLMAAAALAWLLGHFAGVTLLTQAAWIGMIQALFLSVFGWRATRRVLFPLAFLLFAVPFGNFLIPPLQDVTARWVVSLLKLTGIPVYRDALYMHIPSGSFFVAEACAGVRFLISTVVLGALVAYVAFTTWWQRILVLALAAGLPVFANVVRVYGIVMIAHLSDYTLAVSADHLVYGWGFFALVTLAFLAITLSFRETDGDDAPPPSLGRQGEGRRGRMAGATGIVAAAVAAVAVSAAAPVYGHLVTAGEAREPLAWQPAPSPPWSSADALTGWRPAFRGADQEVLRRYAADGRTVDVYVALYGAQRQGKEVVNELNTFADGERWTTVGGGRRAAVVGGEGGGEEVDLRYAHLRSGATSRLVWYWYWIDGRFTGDPIMAKLYEVRAKLTGGSGAAAVIAVATDDEDRQEAAETLSRFLRHLEGLKPSLGEALS